MSISGGLKNHFLNSLIWRGRKITAENFFTSILLELKSLIDLDAFEVFYFSTLSLRPFVFLRPVKVGSVNYRVPAPISMHKRRLYAVKFILQAAKDSRGLLTTTRISSILSDIYLGNKNLASDKKYNLYLEATSNVSFIRYLR